MNGIAKSRKDIYRIIRYPWWQLFRKFAIDDIGHPYIDAGDPLFVFMQTRLNCTEFRFYLRK